MVIKKCRTKVETETSSFLYFSFKQNFQRYKTEKSEIWFYRNDVVVCRKTLHLVFLARMIIDEYLTSVEQNILSGSV